MGSPESLMMQAGHQKNRTGLEGRNSAPSSDLWEFGEGSVQLGHKRSQTKMFKSVRSMITSKCWEGGVPGEGRAGPHPSPLALSCVSLPFDYS